jgi:hypothetical protein
MLLKLHSNWETHRFYANRECQWPLGHPGESGFRFCCKTVTTPGTYCDECLRKYKPYRKIGEPYE